MREELKSRNHCCGPRGYAYGYGGHRVEIIKKKKKRKKEKKKEKKK